MDVKAYVRDINTMVVNLKHLRWQLITPTPTIRASTSPIQQDQHHNHPDLNLSNQTSSPPTNPTPAPPPTPSTSPSSPPDSASPHKSPRSDSHRRPGTRPAAPPRRGPCGPRARTASSRTARWLHAARRARPRVRIALPRRCLCLYLRLRLRLHSYLCAGVEGREGRRRILVLRDKEGRLLVVVVVVVVGCFAARRDYWLRGWTFQRLGDFAIGIFDLFQADWTEYRAL